MQLPAPLPSQGASARAVQDLCNLAVQQKAARQSTTVLLRADVLLARMALGSASRPASSASGSLGPPPAAAASPETQLGESHPGASRACPYESFQSCIMQLLVLWALCVLLRAASARAVSEGAAGLERKWSRQRHAIALHMSTWHFSSPHVCCAGPLRLEVDPQALPFPQANGIPDAVRHALTQGIRSLGIGALPQVALAAVLEHSTLELSTDAQQGEEVLLHAAGVKQAQRALQVMLRQRTVGGEALLAEFKGQYGGRLVRLLAEQRDCARLVRQQLGPGGGQHAARALLRADLLLGEACSVRDAGLPAEEQAAGSRQQAQGQQPGTLVEHALQTAAAPATPARKAGGRGARSRKGKQQEEHARQQAPQLGEQQRVAQQQAERQLQTVLQQAGAQQRTTQEQGEQQQQVAQQPSGRQQRARHRQGSQQQEQQQQAAQQLAAQEKSPTAWGCTGENTLASPASVLAELQSTQELKEAADAGIEAVLVGRYMAALCNMEAQEQNAHVGQHCMYNCGRLHRLVYILLRVPKAFLSARLIHLALTGSY